MCTFRIVFCNWREQHETPGIISVDFREIDTEWYFRLIFTLVCLSLWNHGVNGECRDLPTTSMSPETRAVWKEGASADTSQLYRPDRDICTCRNVSWVALDFPCCKRTATFRRYMTGLGDCEDVGLWNRCDTADRSPHLSSLSDPNLILLLVFKRPT
jgi:hypothetical protein